MVADGQQIQEYYLQNGESRSGGVNQNYNEVSLHTGQNGHDQTINTGGDGEKMEPSCTVVGNVNWYSHYGKQYGGSLKNCKQNYHMTQKSHSWAYTQRKPYFKKTYTTQ